MIFIISSSFSANRLHRLHPHHPHHHRSLLHRLHLRLHRLRRPHRPRSLPLPVFRYPTSRAYPKSTGFVF